MTRTIVIVGHGMTGHRLAARVRELDTGDHWHIVVLAEEPDPAYDRVALSGYLAGRTRQSLRLSGAEFLQDDRTDLHLGCPVAAVDRTARKVMTAYQGAISYDALVLATGSRPFVPPVPGHELANCFVYRTFGDLDALRAAARPGAPGVVVGGGLLGLEAANALRLLGMRPHVIETAPHVMPAQLDAGAARVLHRGAEDLGLRLHCDTAVGSLDGDSSGRVRAVTLKDGAVLDAALVVFAAGIRPRDELAPGSGLQRAERGGFLVDAYCRTADPRVWAVGECAAVEGRCYGLVAPGHRMAESVARQLTGLPAEPFDGSDTSTALKLLDVHVATFGSMSDTDPTLELVFAEGTSRYAKVFLDPDGSRLRGGILAGDTGARTTLSAFVGRRPPADLEQLLLPPRAANA
ncbi:MULTISPECIES: FAD-dependent oxidoreductase [unclassified Streptomyces]|uniref:NAD(P)/FAD-dependent oxidoreductase n=1 Tax=unclassified Streptomyces TaxID=2593676 RepID=UPI0033AB5AB8